MTKKQRKIISIDIELEDFEPIHLKMDEAKELYEQLHDLFGDKERDVQHYYIPWYRQPYYTWYEYTSSPTITTTGTAQVVSENTGMQVGYNYAA